MAITNGYATLNEVRRRLPDGPIVDDNDLESIIEGVSRFVDKDRGRRFYAVSETRYYVPASANFVVIDDLLSLTTLKTDEDGDQTFERTWTSADYLLSPFNAALDGKPYFSIERSRLGSLLFPVDFRSVEVAGSFGYASTTPKTVHEYCILFSMRLLERKESLFGHAVITAKKVVQIVGLDKDTEMLAMLNAIPKRWTK